MVASTEVYLIRHGIAAEREPNVNDEERSLTDEGRRKTKKVAKKLQELGLHFDLLITSPLVRARQTAEILQSVGLSSQIEESLHLAPAGDIHAGLSWLEKWRQADGTTRRLALVGHQPNLGDWAETLVWGISNEKLILKKAGAIGLKLPETGTLIGNSQIFWLTAPKLMLAEL